MFYSSLKECSKVRCFSSALLKAVKGREKFVYKSQWFQNESREGSGGGKVVRATDS